MHHHLFLERKAVQYQALRFLLVVLSIVAVNLIWQLILYYSLESNSLRGLVFRMNKFYSVLASALFFAYLLEKWQHFPRWKLLFCSGLYGLFCQLLGYLPMIFSMYSKSSFGYPKGFFEKYYPYAIKNMLKEIVIFIIVGFIATWLYRLHQDKIAKLSANISKGV